MGRGNVMRMNWKVWVLVGVGVLVGPAVQAQERKHHVFVGLWWLNAGVIKGIWEFGYEYRLGRSGALQLESLSPWRAGGELILLTSVNGVFLPRLYGPWRLELGGGVGIVWVVGETVDFFPRPLAGVRWEGRRWVFRFGVPIPTKNGIIFYFSSGVLF